MSDQGNKSALHVRVSVERGDAGESIRGELQRPDGESVPFSGWLGLIATIEGAVAPPTLPATDEADPPPTHDGYRFPVQG